jgi:hypothetical protein
MTSFIGCSAWDITNRTPFATKKALREAVATRPDEVILTTTSFHAAVRQIPATHIVAGEVWQVVGPTPLNRKWYANVAVKGNPGKPVAS